MSLCRFLGCFITLSKVLAENKTDGYDKAGVVENGNSIESPKFEAQHYGGIINYLNSTKF